MNAPEPTLTDGKLPVVFDLDGTLAEATWPSNHVGRRIQDGIELMLEYASRGYAIVIHTARPPSHEARIWAWLEENGLQNVVFNVVCGKPLGCLYVDDRALRPDYVDGLPEEPWEPPVTREEEPDPRYEPDVEDEGAPAPNANDPSMWTVLG